MKHRRLLDIHTPLILSHPLSQITGKNIYLKCESLQPSGAFKDRGIGALCTHYAQQGVKGFVASSGGNAGMAVAYASAALGLPAHIIIPKTTPPAVIPRLEAEGAEVLVTGENWDDADQVARQLSEDKHYAYIPPFNHPIIWAAYEKIIDELIEDDVKPDAIIVSVGGGGLFTGLVQGLDRNAWKDVTLITAETTGAASFAKAIEANKRIRLDKIDTIATTLGAKQVCEAAFTAAQTHSVRPQVVTDKEAVQACLRFANDHRLLVEPACGAALALLYKQVKAIQDVNNIVIIICGGSGVNLSLLNEWKTRFSL